MHRDYTCLFLLIPRQYGARSAGDVAIYEQILELFSKISDNQFFTGRYIIRMESVH